MTVRWEQRIAAALVSAPRADRFPPLCRCPGRADPADTMDSTCRDRRGALQVTSVVVLVAIPAVAALVYPPRVVNRPASAGDPSRSSMSSRQSDGASETCFHEGRGIWPDRFLASRDFYSGFPAGGSGSRRLRSPAATIGKCAPEDMRCFATVSRRRKNGLWYRQWPHSLARPVLSLRQPPARLLAMIWRNIAAKAESLIASFS